MIPDCTECGAIGHKHVRELTIYAYSPQLLDTIPITFYQCALCKSVFIP